MEVVSWIWWLWTNVIWCWYSSYNESIWWSHQMEHFPCYWPFVRGIHQSPVDFPHKGQWRRASMFSLIGASTNSWANNWDAGHLRCHCTHYHVTVMMYSLYWNISPRAFISLIFLKRYQYTLVQEDVSLIMYKKKMKASTLLQHLSYYIHFYKAFHFISLCPITNFLVIIS